MVSFAPQRSELLAVLMMASTLSLVVSSVTTLIFPVCSNRFPVWIPWNHKERITRLESALLLIVVLMAFYWFWMDGSRAREVATTAVRRGCEVRDLQFLDGTVELNQLWLCRTVQGVRIRRTFRFDYSDDGASRYSGHAVVCGGKLLDISYGLLTI